MCCNIFIVSLQTDNPYYFITNIFTDLCLRKTKEKSCMEFYLLFYFRFLPFTLQNSSSSNNFPSAR